MKPIRPSASEVAMMKMSRFGSTKAAESAKHPAATTPRLPASPSMLSSRLNAFVRPTSQRIPIAQRERLVRDELDRDRAVEDEERGDELGAELRRRMKVDDVVEQPEREHDPSGADHRQHLARNPDRADRRCDDDGDGEAGVDPDPSESRGRARVPAVGARVGPERLERARPAEQPCDDGEGDRRRSDGEECVHGLVWERVADACGIDRRSLTPGVGGHGARQHSPYNPAVAVYADLFRYRELFASLFQRDLRAKYKGSALGLLWTLALPVTLMLVYLVVFSVMWKSPTTDVDHYWLFLLCGLPPWVFFATSVQSSARSLLENASLIRKVRFPRQLVPLSIVATQLVAFVVMTGIVIVLAMIVLPDSRRPRGSRSRSAP